MPVFQSPGPAKEEEKPWDTHPGQGAEENRYSREIWLAERSSCSGYQQGEERGSRAKNRRRVVEHETFALGQVPGISQSDEGIIIQVGWIAKSGDQWIKTEDTQQDQRDDSRITDEFS